MKSEQKRIGGTVVDCPADALPESAFRHETGGVGRHRFAAPVLFSDAHPDGFRRIMVTEPVTMSHEPTEGAVHPQVVLPPGQFIVSGTARSLRGGDND
jgi:hypothetical protein